MSRRATASLLCACLFMLAGWARASEATPLAPLSRYDRVAVAATKTSVYVGTVSMTMSDFVRKDGAYGADYTAKVFPYFFLNESGRLSIDFSNDQLRALERGEVVEFKGRGVRADGTERHVEGKATPADASSGKLKVRVFVSKKTELIFNTTYRFEPEAEQLHSAARKVERLDPKTLPQDVSTPLKPASSGEAAPPAVTAPSGK